SPPELSSIGSRPAAPGVCSTVSRMWATVGMGRASVGDTVRRREIASWVRATSDSRWHRMTGNMAPADAIECSPDVDDRMGPQAAGLDLEEADGVGGGPALPGRGAGVEEALAVDALGVQRQVAVAEHDQVGLGEPPPHPARPPG